MTWFVPPTTTGLSLAAIVFFSFILGLVHGATPDEHTWPITFSYAIGSYSTRAGYRNGLTFSAAFTLQRAVASELAFLGLAALFAAVGLNAYIYILVGLAMAVVGYILLRRARYLHFHRWEMLLHRGLNRVLGGPPEDHFGHHHAPDSEAPDFTPTSPYVAMLHGFIAGWGFGPFALILYVFLAPQMGSAWVGWVPGALFGLGTLVMQVIFGAYFGHWIGTRRGLGKEGIQRLGRRISGNILFYGGLVFIAGGLLEIAFPVLATLSIPTGIPIYNLNQINDGFVLVLLSVGVVGILSARQGLREVHQLLASAPTSDSGPVPVPPPPGS
ncbi:hypothetical protein B1B_11288 [mine drainage metagenome]|uniref:Uncharacterized protein n=1 Tax=mine drainage metagenome TaxID=410659 RepID=T1BBB7_9ZZZZ